MTDKKSYEPEDRQEPQPEEILRVMKDANGELYIEGKKINIARMNDALYLRAWLDDVMFSVIQQMKHHALQAQQMQSQLKAASNGNMLEALRRRKK